MAEVDGSTQTEQDTLDLHKLNTDPCEEKERVQINNTSHASSTTPPLSKTQLKKRKKYEQLQEQYKAKKLKQKEQKVQTRAKRAEEKKIFLETRTPEQIAEFEERRNKAKMDLKQQKEDRNTRLTEVYANPRAQPIVCIDCSFNDKMTSKEMTSLAHQLSYCYSHNSKSEKPLCLAISSLQGELLTHFQRYSGSDKWRIIKDQEHFTKIFPGPETIVYLSADSPNTLTSLEAGTVYVLGGLVDRNRYKNISLQEAQKYGVRTAKLPLDKVKLESSPVFTVNHVFEVLVRFYETNDWQEAFDKVVPKRKKKEQDDQEADDDEAPPLDDQVIQK